MRRALALAAAALSASCLSTRAAQDPVGTLVTFEGACDASGSVPVDGRRFVVADDEDNTLRVFDADEGGFALEAGDVSGGIALEPTAKPKKQPKRPKKKPKPPKAKKPREADLEAATRLGDRALWISSHGRSKSGKVAVDRMRYFATAIPSSEAPLAVVGTVYRGLLDDLIAAPQLARYDLAGAAERAPQEPGGLNIEGLTAAPEGFVWIGFRNPVPDGRALLVPLLNPVGLSTATPARFGTPVELDLGGRGVRALSWWRGRYLILGGASGGSALDTRLYTWTATEAGARELPLQLGDLNPEAMFTPEDRDRIMLLSDDGEREIAGERCKDLADPDQKRFRGLWVDISALPARSRH